VTPRVFLRALFSAGRISHRLVHTYSRYKKESLASRRSDRSDGRSHTVSTPSTKSHQAQLQIFFARLRLPYPHNGSKVFPCFPFDPCCTYFIMVYQHQILLTLPLLLARRGHSFQMIVTRSGFEYHSTFRAYATSVYHEEEIETEQDDESGSSALLRAMTFSNIRKDQEPQLLCNFLMELGACSTSTTDADYGTDEERPLFDEFDAITMMRTTISTDSWEHCNLVAHFPASTDLAWIMELVEDAFPNLPKYEVARVENKDWVFHGTRMRWFRKPWWRLVPLKPRKLRLWS